MSDKLSSLQVDSVIFDLDGTLWDNTRVEVKSYNEMMGDIRPEVTLDEVRAILGLQHVQIGERLFPMLDSEAAARMMQKCCDNECVLVKREGGKIFDCVEMTLQKLSSKFSLHIVSNCQCGYIEAFLEFHGFSKYFSDFLCAGKSGFTKGENIKMIIARNHLKSPVYVGDTQLDRDSAVFAGIPFIFASYGFGKVDSYDYEIHAPKELIDILL
jgi:phosphoglycolate phosphatase